MKTIFAFALLSLLVTGQAQAQPLWSVVVYAATDEEELGPYGETMVQELLHAPLPDNVELLIEHDGVGKQPVRRTIRRGQARAVTKFLSEHDSADTTVLGSFFSWAKANARGRHRMLVVGTHSWGWKGIIQDYDVPNLPDGNTMMPLREFARVLGESELKPSVIFMDSCVLGNVEAIDQLRDTARYLVISQRETPYSGFPYPAMLKALSNPELGPRAVAARIPEAYAAAYSHDGTYAEREGSYDVVTATALDMKNWDGFVAGFRSWVAALERAGLREMLTRSPEWAAPVWDEDFNVDLVEVLHRLPHALNDEAVSARAADLLNSIGYPNDAAEKGAATLTLLPTDMKFFELQIEGDPYVARESNDAALASFQKIWKAANQDLILPDSLQFKIDTSRSTPRYLVRGAVEGPLALRPWLTGTRNIRLGYLGVDDKWQHRNFSRAKDFVSVRSFPEGSIYLSEAHTQGAPFIHGIGIDFRPLMDKDEERSQDVLTGLSGPAFYKSLSWNRRTGWGDLILLKNE